MVQSVDFRRMREVIAHIPKQRDRVLIKTLYLTALRVSEIVTKARTYDLEHGKSKAYGKHLHWKFDKFIVNRKHTETALLITAATAKRKLKTKEQKEQGFIPKVIALPVMPVYEPFTEELVRWLKVHDTLSFPIARQRVWEIVKKHLRELDPKVSPHSLRHWRLTNLVEKYQFNPPDLTAYAGWSVTQSFAAVGIPAKPILNIYYHSAWQNYFPKLLKPIKDLL